MSRARQHGSSLASPGLSALGEDREPFKLLGPRTANRMSGLRAFPLERRVSLPGLTPQSDDEKRVTMGAGITCGIDWSERHHDVALVDRDGALDAKRRLGESVEGLLSCSRCSRPPATAQSSQFR